MELQKPHDLPSAGWMIRNAGAVIQSELKKPEKGRVGNGISPSLRSRAPEPGMPTSKGRRRWMSQFNQKEQVCPNLCLFVLLRPSTDWTMITHIAEDDILSLPIQMLISSKNILWDTLRNTVLPATWYPLTQSCCHVKLTIMVEVAAFVLWGLLWLDDVRDTSAGSGGFSCPPC